MPTGENLNTRNKPPMKTNKRRASYGTPLKQTLQILPPFFTPLRLLLAALAFCAASVSAQVVPVLTWDAGNTNNGVTIDSASGAWDTDTTTNLNWNNGIGNVSWTQTSTTAPLVQSTVFSGPDGAYQVALDGTQISLSNMTINASGYTFSGSPLNAAINSIFT